MFDQNIDQLNDQSGMKNTNSLSSLDDNTVLLENLGVNNVLQPAQ